MSCSTSMEIQSDRVVETERDRRNFRNRVDCGLRSRDRKSKKERGHRSEIKHFCVKTTELPVTLVLYFSAVMLKAMICGW